MSVIATDRQSLIPASADRIDFRSISLPNADREGSDFVSSFCAGQDFAPIALQAEDFRITATNSSISWSKALVL